MSDTTDRDLHELAVKQAALGEVRGAPAADPVNAPMIRHWLDAMGDANPVYLDQGIAPPAMAQVWTMPGVRRGAKQGSPVDDVMAALDAGGFTGVVATNCEQTYHRPARLGERLTSATRFTDLAGPKRTALGEGYFATWNVTWYAESGEAVAEMLFRVLKFRPPERRPPSPPAEERRPYPLRPAVNRDTEFFWEGVRQGELRIQSCADCGELRHPPGPICPHCRSTNRAHVVASGEGTVYSYVVHHHPPVPGREPPFVVAVVSLPEGVRIVGNIVDCPPEAVGIGMSLRVTYRSMDDELVLPMWAPREP
ncbi:bifunctional MaoC family dehydratase N-terminal/OB-fold nucleic acid binding domain-containing protein [Nonomuraea sp. LPB2021202275-12-8]|uniref:bifunctional MaoC family dehydratase N-terminal/OB-fold nucleic acid binding domain-containing protein n=1 Tax=Nonomuraea sp. LPB2021202275-12-8 TaxID=3120159 RepID=UPI00300D036D